MGLKDLTSESNNELRRIYKQYTDSILMLTRSKQEEKTSREDIINMARILKENSDYHSVSTTTERSEIESMIKTCEDKLK